MTPQQILANAREINSRYNRGLITLAELNAELWQLAHELAFYSHTDSQWKVRQASWANHPELEDEFWREMYAQICEACQPLPVEGQ